MPESPTLALIDQYQPKFESQWRRLSQQPDSRLSKAVSLSTGCTGDVNYLDQIKPIDVISLGSPGQNRIQPTPISEIETAKRANYPEKFHVPKHFDEFDEIWLKAQSKPTSQTFLEMKSGFNRKMDDLIINAATGIARAGNAGSVNVELPDSQKINVQVGSPNGAPANTGFNLAKWLDVKEQMEASEVFGQDVDGVEEMGYIALTSKQLRNLYDEAKITSSDYAGELEALYRGEIDKFLKFQVIRTERLLKAGNIRTCFAWVKSGIALDIWKNPTFKLSERTDYNDAAQLRGVAAAGSTRLEEPKVVEIPCDESV